MTSETVASNGDSLELCCQLLALADELMRRAQREPHALTTLVVVGVLADSITTATLMECDSVEALRARDKMSSVLRALRDDADALACRSPAVNERRAQLVAQLEGQLRKRK